MTSILATVAVVLGTSGFISNAQTPVKAPKAQQIKTAKGMFAVPGIGFLDGRDLHATPKLTIMQINVWDAVQRTRPVCKLTHGTTVEIAAAQLHAAENRYYFRVKATGCQGWVPESFLSPKKHAAVGDRM